MSDVNDIKSSGTIEPLQPINTKSRTPMAKWMLRVGQDLFKCVALAHGQLKLTDRLFAAQRRIIRRGKNADRTKRAEVGTWSSTYIKRTVLSLAGNFLSRKCQGSVNHG